MAALLVRHARTPSVRRAPARPVATFPIGRLGTLTPIPGAAGKGSGEQEEMSTVPSSWAVSGPGPEAVSGPASGAARTPGSRASGRGGRGGDPPADPEAAAREICLRLLSLSPRTHAQLAGALRRKGVPDEVTERVLGRYTEVGLIDDVAFSRAWVQSRHAGRGLARRALAAELRQRGVDDETVNEAVEELDPAQEETAARELVAKRMAATRGLDPTKRTRRILGTLARKGYSSALSYRLVREALESEGVDDLPDLPQDD